jgi:plasmid stabilization system protein ParE
MPQCDRVLLAGYPSIRCPSAILDAALSLTFLPRRGVAVRHRPGLRKLVHSYYLIFYQVNEAQRWVEVVRIWDGRQHPDTLNLP